MSSSKIPVRFTFSQGRSEIYGKLYRPSAKVYIRTDRGTWLPHYMLVDSGADYTLLPKSIDEFIGLRKDIADHLYHSGGVGGGKIWVVMRRLKMRLGDYEFMADVGWAHSDNVPLLLGRADVFERFEVHFKQHEKVTEFHWRGT